MSELSYAPMVDDAAEEAVLGGIFRAAVSDRLDVVERVRATGLVPEAFTNQRRRLAFESACSLAERGLSPDVVAVATELGHGDDGLAWLRSLYEIASSFSNSAHFAAQVVEAARRRKHQRALAAAADALVEGRIVDVVAPTAETGVAADWLERASDVLADPDPGETPFLVAGLVVDRAITAIQGPPKVGKTWVAEELAVSVVTGEPALGFLPIREPGPALLVLEESGRVALARRLGMLARGRAIAPERLADLHVAPNRRVRLDDPVWQARLLAAARAIRPRAIFFDPIVRLKGSERNENLQSEMAPILDFLRDLRDVAEAAVVFVHHTGHSNGNRMRGTSDFEAYWESKLSLSRSGKTVTLRADHRDAESGFEVRYRPRFDATTDSVRLVPVDAEPVEEEEPEPGLPERIVEYVAGADEPTGRDVEAGVRGKAETIRETLSALLLDGVLRKAEARPRDHANAVRYTVPEQRVPDRDTSGTHQDRASRPDDASPPPYRGGTHRLGTHHSERVPGFVPDPEETGSFPRAGADEDDLVDLMRAAGLDAREVGA